MKVVVAIAMLTLAAVAQAQVEVKDPWVRATTPQAVTGAFMKLESRAPAKLVEVRSPVAGQVELHETRMEHGVAKMMHVHSIALPAELKPGGYHVMLMALKRQLKEGETVPLELVVETGGKRQIVAVKASVRSIQGQPQKKGHGHGH